MGVIVGSGVAVGMGSAVSCALQALSHRLTPQSRQSADRLSKFTEIPLAEGGQSRDFGAAA
jgi:hypothetical protein